MEHGERKMHNPYTCRLLRRIDYIIYFILGKNPYWHKKSGHLCIKNSEAETFFPGCFYRLSAKIANRHLWTRNILGI